MEISEENTAYFMDYPDSSGVELAKKTRKTSFYTIMSDILTTRGYLQSSPSVLDSSIFLFDS